MVIQARRRPTAENITTFMHIKDLRGRGRRDNPFSSFMVAQLAMGLSCLNLHSLDRRKAFLNSKGWEVVKLPISGKKK